jgi:hypothetical protein
MEADMRVGLGLQGRLLAALAAMGVVCPTVLSADEIRILFVVSRAAGVVVDTQVRKLERAIGDGPGPLGVATSLSEAHVVVQFTGYRRSIGEKGEPVFHWIGQAMLLKQPEEMTVSQTPLPERFELLVIGEDGREEQRALKSLELMLSKTLRPRARKPVKEII